MNLLLSPFVLHRASITLLIAVAPLAVAAQNIATFLCLILMLFARASRKKQQAGGGERVEQIRYRGPAIWVGLFVVVGLASSVLAEVSILDLSRYLFGWAPLILIPLLFDVDSNGDRLANLRSGDYRVVVWVLAVWLSVFLLQRVFGFAFVSGGIVWGRHRVQGFYSHPLTLAYVLLVFLPTLITFVFLSKSAAMRSLALLFMSFGLYASESRTVQVTAVFVSLSFLYRFVGARAKALAVFVAMLLFAVASLTDNPVRTKYIETVERFSARSAAGIDPDDRISFWRVHVQLFMESPLIGNGLFIPSARLEETYGKLGLGQMKDKYNAHNQFLQVLANSGVVGLIAFLGYFAALIRTSFGQPQLWSWTMRATVFGICIGMLTQNALDDSEVRFAFMVVLALLFDRTVFSSASTNRRA